MYSIATTTNTNNTSKNTAGWALPHHRHEIVVCFSWHILQVVAKSLSPTSSSSEIMSNEKSQRSDDKVTTFNTAVILNAVGALMSHIQQYLRALCATVCQLTTRNIFSSDPSCAFLESYSLFCDTLLIAGTTKIFTSATFTLAAISRIPFEAFVFYRMNK